MAQKRPFNDGRRRFKTNKKQKKNTVNDGSNEDVLLADVRRLLNKTKIAEEDPNTRSLPEQYSEIELTISELSSTGDGLAEKDGQVYVVPFAAPGDTLVAKIYRHSSEERYSLADFVKVVEPSQYRTETPKCQYFAQCSGCQFQHLPYSHQLSHKRKVVEKAYANFSNLPPESIPPIRDTQGSPLQYGYRTKLTPHFDGPPGGRRDKRNGKQVTWPEVPPIGFMKKGTRKTLDIEDCPIGTEAVRMGMESERIRVAEQINTYQKGATILLRESTERLNQPADSQNEKPDHENVILEEHDDFTYRKTCITDNNATSTEYVDDFRFDNPAGAFFQNNNSILPLVTQYLRDNIFGPSASSGQPKITNLIDAYCGSGFFTITLSSLFERSIGIDIADKSIISAKNNAKLNHLPESSRNFIAADANQLFASVDSSKFRPAETVVVIDPPRKGCDQGFIKQLLEYGPGRICYVSCNVHTQARDVGWLVGGIEDESGEAVEGLYEIESLRGFDFFPQTSHVEGVAFLRKKTSAPSDMSADIDVAD